MRDIISMMDDLTGNMKLINYDITYHYNSFHWLYLYTIFDQYRIDIIDQVENGVNDRLHIYHMYGIFYFSLHKHQIEGTNGF